MLDLDKKATLQNIESNLTELLLALNVDAQNLGIHDAHERRQKLLTMTREALAKLDEGKATGSAPMSLSGPALASNEEERAASALSRGMGHRGSRWA